MVHFGFFWPEYSGPPLEVVHLFVSEYSDRNLSFHFWQTGSLPLLGNLEEKQTVARAIPIGWPGLIGKCRSILLGNSHWSLTGRFGIMESTLISFAAQACSQPLRPESRNAPRPHVRGAGDGDRCVTPARAAAKETSLHLATSKIVVKKAN